MNVVVAGSGPTGTEAIKSTWSEKGPMDCAVTLNCGPRVPEGTVRVAGETDSIKSGEPVLLFRQPEADRITPAKNIKLAIRFIAFMVSSPLFLNLPLPSVLDSPQTLFASFTASG
jgi:hypothetical protein